MIVTLVLVIRINQQINTIIVIIVLLIKVDYSALTKKIETNSKALEFKVNDIARITKYKNIFSKGYTANWPREIFIIDSVSKNNPWTYKQRKNNRKFL